MGFLASICNKIFIDGHLPLSWMQSVVSVIPKEDSDLTLPSSYRPISLLNVDYKIFTAALAVRLNTFLAHYIKPDQVGFIPGWDLVENI